MGSSTPKRQNPQGPLQRWRDDSPVATAIALFLVVDLLAAVILVPLALLHIIHLPVWAIILLAPGMTVGMLLAGALVSMSWRGASKAGPATRLPDGMREVVGPDASPDWGRDGPPIRLADGVQHRIEGTSPHGRPYLLVATRSGKTVIWHVLLKLDGWLPHLTVMPQLASIPGLERDAARVEDHEFNRRYDITSFDRSTAAQRYAHAFFTPRMMEYLLSIEPASFDVRGTWLVDDMYPDSADEALRRHRRILERLENIADRIPSHLYGMFDGDSEVRARCRAANERNRVVPPRRKGGRAPR